VPSLWLGALNISEKQSGRLERWRPVSHSG